MNYDAEDGTVNQRQRAAPPLPPPPPATRQQLRRPPAAAYEGSLHQYELAATRAMRSGGDDDDLARPEAEDADVAAAPPHVTRARSQRQRRPSHFAEPRHPSLYEQGHLLQQRWLREARKRDRKPRAVGATTQAYTAAFSFSFFFHLPLQGQTGSLWLPLTLRAADGRQVAELVVAARGAAAGRCE